MRGYKQCPNCEKKVPAGQRVCTSCEYEFYPLDRSNYTRPTPQVVEPKVKLPPPTPVVRDEQVIIQECFPPQFLYLGNHTFTNVELNGNHVTIYLGLKPDKKTIQADNLKQLVTIAWNAYLMPEHK